MPSDKPKYSGLLDNNQLEILEKFCQLHNVSKSQAIGILLEQWNNSGQPQLETNQIEFNQDKVIDLVTNLVNGLFPNAVNYSVRMRSEKLR